MRRLDRIRPIIEAVQIYWEENQDLRLMQLLLNACALTTIDPYYIEDEGLMELLRRMYDKR